MKKIKCPNCQTIIEVGTGEYLECPNCGKRYKNPAYQPQASAEAATAQVAPVAAAQVAAPAKPVENSPANEVVVASVVQKENPASALMTEDQKGELLRHFSWYLPKNETINFLAALNGAKQDKYALLMSYQPKSPLYTSLFAMFGGFLGMDRFYIGSKGSAVCKLIFGIATFGLWYLIDIFVTYKKCRKKNLEALMNLLTVGAVKGK